MACDQAQVDRLKTYCEGVSSAVVGSVTYLVLKALRLPASAGVATVDAMIRLGDTGDGYACDPDVVEDTNLNRLVGATEEDAKRRTRKVDVAARLIQGLAPNAWIEAFFGKWEQNAETLRGVDLVFGCLDGYAARQSLEAFTRRYLLPLVDIGMDVHSAPGEPPSMSGQVILSMPGGLCMTCIGFLNSSTLAQEATNYGDAGIRPQVIWANGVLASTAVGIAVDVLTGWSGRAVAHIYLDYDGNTNTLAPHKRMRFALPAKCEHYPTDDIEQVGDPVLRTL